MNAAVTHQEKAAPLELNAGALVDSFDRTPRFAHVSCSQCGGTFGAGDHGFSHCHQHPPYFTREQNDAMAEERTEATRRRRHEYESKYLETTITVEYEFEYGEKTPSPRVSPVAIDLLSIRRDGWDVGMFLDCGIWGAVQNEVEAAVLR